jgi:predicted CopG family antitoxin
MSKRSKERSERSKTRVTSLPKNGQTKTIEISTEVYDILHSVQSKLEKYLKKKVNFDLLLRVFFILTNTDGLIRELNELTYEKDILKGMKT